jgi:hypothetical protein
VTVAETLLVYVVAPLAVFLVFAALIYIPGARKRRAHWKSGQPWEHEPLFYGPQSEHPTSDDDDHDEPGLGTAHAALPAGATASRALASGAQPGEDDVPARLAGGPLGGARGTW